MKREEGFEAWLEREGIGGGTAAQARRFLSLLRKWNARMSLTGSVEWKALEPFWGEAIWAARQYPEGGARHLDIGSGAGFPALLMRIFRPRMKLVLLESREKRCIFLETAALELGLTGTRVVQARLSDFLAEGGSSWDCISWKGVKLESGNLGELARRAGEETRFWMFHGRGIAAEEPEKLDEVLALERRLPCPARPGWQLSIYRRKCFT